MLPSKPLSFQLYIIFPLVYILKTIIKHFHTARPTQKLYNLMKKATSKNIFFLKSLVIIAVEIVCITGKVSHFVFNFSSYLSQKWFPLIHNLCDIAKQLGVSFIFFFVYASTPTIMVYRVK